MTEEDLIQIEDDARMSVVNEKLHAQHDAGRKIRLICNQIGRCGICTLLPPCKHISNHIHSELSSQPSLDQQAIARSQTLNKEIDRSVRNIFGQE